MSEATTHDTRLRARRRSDTGKGVARRLRDAGQIPGVLYGGSQGPVPIALSSDDLVAALDPQRKRNTLLLLTVEDSADQPSGKGSVEQSHVMVKNAQFEPIRDTWLHVDFVRTAPEQLVRVQVPLQLEGRAEGVKAGGALHQVRRTLPVECPASKIPAGLVGEVTSLGIGQTLSVDQLEVPDSVKVCLPGQQTCAMVMAPRKSAESAGDAAGDEPAAEPQAKA